MIYLIDDKKLRQENDYGWDLKKLQKYEQIIQPIYDLDELSKRRKDIFKANNIILYHESFLDNTYLKHEALLKRSDLDEFSSKQNNWVAFFSGSKNSRTIEGNIAHLPVSILYQNLEIFIQRCLQGDFQLNYLLFGENPSVEQELVEKLENCLNSTEEESSAEIVSSNILFFRPAKLNITNPIEGVQEIILFNDVSDEKLSQKIIKELSVKKYDMIFLPLCFGPTLSDYNGLRLATHIRCTNTSNNVSSIFIYSPTNIEELIRNKYFDILKTKNVELVDFKKKAFEIAANKSRNELTKEELPKEMKKVKLEPPKNYEDSHSIANEWAIYRWASALNANDEDIQRITNAVQYNLYFKYLKTIFPVKNIAPITKSGLKIKYSGTPNILYIDDEADKGWFEIYCKILDDLNGLGFHYLDGELSNLSREEIIEKSISFIETKNIDLVLLDFRLHPDDFHAIDLKEVTGLKLLKAIKKLNPGIQVIIFSATNKIWNFQSLQEAGADGFIIKESPDNNLDHDFTNKAIQSLINSLNTALKRRFLKDFFVLIRKVQSQLANTETQDDTEYHHFILDLQKHSKIIESAGKQINLKKSSTLDITFLNCYNFLEKFKHYYLNDVNYQLVLGIEEVEMNRYSNSNNEIRNEGKFVRNNNRDNPSWFNCLAGLFIDYFLLSTVQDQNVVNLNRVKDKRNNYIHGSKKQFDQNEILMILNLCVDITSNLKE